MHSAKASNKASTSPVTEVPREAAFICRPNYRKAAAIAKGSTIRFLFLGKGASVAVVAGEIFVDRVDVEKLITSWVQLFELFAAALGQNGVTGIAITRLDGSLAV